MIGIMVSDKGVKLFFQLWPFTFKTTNNGFDFSYISSLPKQMQKSVSLREGAVEPKQSLIASQQKLLRSSVWMKKRLEGNSSIFHFFRDLLFTREL